MIRQIWRRKLEAFIFAAVATAAIVSLPFAIVSLRAQLDPPDIQDSGLVTNPAANASLVELTGRAAGSHNFTFILSCSVNAAVVAEWRSSANAVKWSQGIFCGSNGTVTVHVDEQQEFELNDKIRLRTNAAVTGSLWGTVAFQ